MGSVVANLYGNSLIIFRPGDADDNSKDIIYYLYKKNELFINETEDNEDIPTEEVIKSGIKIMTIKQLERTAQQKHRLLTQTIAEKTSGGEDLAYKLFSFLLLIKIAIKTIISYTYSKSLVELSQLLVGFENEVAYNLAQYFLDELNYRIGFSDNVLNKLEDKDQFTHYYKKLKKILEDAKDLDKNTVENAYKLFREAVGTK
ncbi:MAG: hypothetical protein NV1_17 [Nanoarchaeotal virus 1]|nr:MAG: hypothetical protein NV1_17 [Nanoarchaeotal virus 1]